MDLHLFKEAFSKGLVRMQRVRMAAGTIARKKNLSCKSTMTHSRNGNNNRHKKRGHDLISETLIFLIYLDKYGIFLNSNLNW